MSKTAIELNTAAADLIAWLDCCGIESHFVEKVRAKLSDQPAPVQELEEYDAGLLATAGGGDVEWWWDYIRAELGRAYEHYRSQMTTPQAPKENT